MIVFLCYCIAVFDFLVIPPTGARQEIPHLDTVTIGDVWDMVKTRAYVLGRGQNHVTLEEVEMVLGKFHSCIRSNKFAAIYGYKGFYLETSFETNEKEGKLYIYRLEKLSDK